MAGGAWKNQPCLPAAEPPSLQRTGCMCAWRKRVAGTLLKKNIKLMADRGNPLPTSHTTPALNTHIVVLLHTAQPPLHTPNPQSTRSSALRHTNP
jgi:hypothetical protein